MVNTVTLNGNSYNDGATGPGNMGNGGHRTNFVPCLSDMLVEMGIRTAAAGTGLVAASSTSLAVGIGSKSLTVTIGKNFAVGMFVELYSSGTPTAYMLGIVTAFTSGTGAMTINVLNGDSGGAGTYTDWIVTVCGRKGNQGLVGFSYGWDAGTTNADPGAGLLRVNNADVTLATALYIDNVDSGAVSAVNWLASLAGSTSTVKGQIVVRALSDPTKWVLYNLTAASAQSGYYALTVAYVAASGATPFSASQAVMIAFTRTGDVGVSGQSYFFDTVTAAADPGAGKFRLNNAAVGSATAAYLDILDTNSADISGWLAALGSSSSAVKGVLRIQSLTTQAKFAEFNVTAAVNSTGYYTLTLAYLSPVSAPTFTANEPIAVMFARTGDLGTTGAGSTVFIAVSGTSTGTARPTINLIPGSGISISAVDNPGATRTDVTVTASFASTVSSPLVTSNTTLSLTQEGALLNSTGGAFTLTLPASPPTGTAFRLIDVGQKLATNKVTLARNGGTGTIMGIAQDCFLDINSIELTVWFNGSDWRFQ